MTLLGADLRGRFGNMLLPLILILLVAAAGITLTRLSHASTPVVSVEAENGTLVGASKVSDTTASGGSAVRFTGGNGVPATGANIRDYGAKGDGVSDDAPAIRAALAKNATIYIPPGNYLLGSFENPRNSRLGADFIASLHTGQTINADPNAILKFGDNVIVNSPAPWQGNLFIADGQSNITINGGVWDFNGQHNLERPGQDVTGYGLYTWGANNVVVENLTMKNTPGQNYIVQQNGGSGFQVLNSTFINGGTEIPQNRLQVDYSAMYFTGANVLVDHVNITNEQLPWLYSGGIELHGTGLVVRNSDIENSYPDFYIGPNDTPAYSGVQRDITVTGNTLSGNRGVTIHDAGNISIAGIKITDNTFHIRTNPNAPDEIASAIEQLPTVNISDVTITGNKFYDDDGSASFAVKLGPASGITVSNNQFNGFSCGMTSGGTLSSILSLSGNTSFTRCGF